MTFEKHGDQKVLRPLIIQNIVNDAENWDDDTHKASNVSQKHKGIVHRSFDKNYISIVVQFKF